MTENHDFEIPHEPEGIGNWDDPLRRDWNRAEVDIENRDVEANLGDYTPSAGSSFRATDTGRIYDGDGSAWSHDRTTGPQPRLDAIQGVADHIVKSLGGLYDAFSNASAGDVIVVTDEEAPYRTEQYLDLNTSDVTVIMRGAFPLVQPADGANVGGIRVGNTTVVDNITIDGFSYHGNPAGQTETSGGFGISLEQGSNHTVRSCRLERTWPYHEHNKENSGIMVRSAVSNYSLESNTFFEIGDRAISTDGTGGQILGNHSISGFDRMVSFSGTGGSGALTTVVANNLLEENAEGSAFGLGGAGSPDDVIIAHNLVVGNHRCLITNQVSDSTSTTSDTRYLFVGNVGINNEQATSDGIDRYPGLRIHASNTSAIGNYCFGYAGEGVELGTGTELPENCVIRGNRFENCRDRSIHYRGGAFNIIEGNVFQNNDTAGNSPGIGDIALENGATDSVVRGNTWISHNNNGGTFGEQTDANRNRYLDNVSFAAGGNGPLNSGTSVASGNSPAASVNLLNITPATSPVRGFHDGTDGASVNPMGPAFYDGTNWVSIIDGTTIS